MKPETLLADGINILRQSDKDIEKLFAPRSEEIIMLLTRYIKEIELFNAAYGLVGVSDTKELIIKHILDSLAPLGIIFRLLHESAVIEPSAAKIADAGSGAGLPGIPLAISLPQCSFTLIERMGRRAGFLCNTKAALASSLKSGLTRDNIIIEEGELEKTSSARFNLITFRAFKPLEPKLLKNLFKACAKDGIIAAYKGRREKIETEMAPLEKFCGKWEAIPCAVPFLDEERHLLVIRGS